MASCPTLGPKSRHERTLNQMENSTYNSSASVELGIERTLPTVSSRISDKASDFNKQEHNLRHFKSIYSPQNFRWKPNGLRSPSYKSSHHTTFHKIHRSPKTSTVATRRCMDGITRHQRCLSTHTSIPINSQVPVFQDQRSDIPVRCTPIRPQCSSFRVHCGAETNTASPQTRRNLSPRLSGRSRCLGTFSYRMQEINLPSSVSTSGTRIHDQPREILSNTNSENKLARFHLDVDRASAVDRKEYRYYKSTSKANARRKPDLTKGTRVSFRSSLICSTIAPENTVLEEVSDTYTAENADRPQTISSDIRTSDTSRNLATSQQLARKRSSKDTCTNHNLVDRCVNQRLGNAQFARRVTEGRMVTHGAQIAYKCSRTHNNSESIEEQSGSDTQQCSNIHRQCCCILRLQKRRLDKEPVTASNLWSNSQYAKETQIDADTLSYSRNSKCGRRCAVATDSDSLRMGNRPARFSENIGMGWPSGGRPHGHAVQCKNSMLCESVCPSRSLSCRRPNNSMAKVEDRIYISTSINARQTITEGAQIHRDPGRSNPEQTSSKTSAVAETGERLITFNVSPLADGGIHTTHFSVVDICRMDRTSFLRSVLARKVGGSMADSLICGYRESTRRQQEFAWKALQYWLSRHPVTHLSEPLLLAFIQSLKLEKGFASQTIAAYKSALSFPLREAFGLDLSSEHFSLLLKSIFLDKPPSRPNVIRWDLCKVLRLLRSTRFNSPNITLEDLLSKTLFLTALATGNRVSEIAAFSREGCTQRQDGSMVLAIRPGFLYKNQTAARTPPPVIVKPLGKNKLCPIRTLKQYLSVTDQSNGRLFIHPTTSRALSRGQISFRICKLIKQADPNGIPQMHDLRRAAASIAWSRGISPEQIVKNAFWSTAGLFIRRYLRDCKASKCVALNSI